MTRSPLSFPMFGRRLMLTIAGVIACVGAGAVSDTWWQLRAGHDIWAHHAVSLVEQYSYTAAGDFWPDHEWLWQALAYGVYHLGGFPLLTLLDGLAVVGAIALLLPARRASRVDIVLIAIALPGLVPTWDQRPQMVSQLLFAMLMVLIRRGRWWWIVPLMLVWANLHAAVTYGGVILLATCATALLWWWRERTSESAQRLRRIVLVTCLSALATLANPMGVGLWRYVVTSVPRSKSDHVEEWMPAYHTLTSFTGAMWLWAALLVIAALWRRDRLRTWQAATQFTTALVMLPLALDAVRNIAFFILAAMPVLSLLLRRHSPSDSGATSAATPVDLGDTVPWGRAITTGAAVLGALITAAVYVHPFPMLGWTPMTPVTEQAIEACPGHVYTTYNNGSYLLWWTPPVKVFVDDRQDPYPSWVLRLGSLGPHTHYQSDFRRFGVDCAALDPGDAGTRRTLVSAGWTAAYRGGGWTVLTKPGVRLDRRTTAAPVGSESVAAARGAMP